jgi:hypothetical protein
MNVAWRFESSSAHSWKAPHLGLSRKARFGGLCCVRAGQETSLMPQNFLGCDREQALLLPLSLREWLDDDHLAWLVLDVVGGIDLTEFYGAYRADGHGRAAHDPAMMVALLLYSYAVGQRSSRAIERR